MTGLHLTIDGWRPGREDDGWRCPAKDIEELKMNGNWVTYGPHERGPRNVAAVPRLMDDVKALKRFFEFPNPPPRFVRGTKTGKVFYGFGDASGSGFGNSFLMLGDIRYDYGQWCSEVVECGSSNWREAENLHQGIKGLADKGLLKDVELFMFTDNLTAENCFTKGSSRSKKLFEIVLAVRLLELRYGFTLHVIHVSGKRMIVQGTDALSRGDATRGVLAGNRWFQYVPLALSAYERNGEIRRLFRDATEGLGFVELTPEDWFDKGHTLERCIWVPAPAATLAMTEQLAEARLKRPEGCHIVIVPRVMTGYWRRQLTRVADGYQRLGWDGVWNLSREHEPVLIFFVLPLISSLPMIDTRGKIMDQLRWVLSGVCQEGDMSRRNLMRRLLQQATKLRTM